MARELRTPQEFREVAATANEIAKMIDEVATLIEESGMSGVWTHGNAPINTYLPKVWEWANKLKTEFESDYRAFAQGKMSKAEYDKRRNQAKHEPPPAVVKKATKKRPKK